MNKKLLEKVAKHIESEPKRFDMSVFMEADSVAPCGTTACIAGWAIILSAPKDVRAKVYAEKSSGWLKEKIACNNEPHPAARRLFEIGDEQADNLFYASCWPRKFVTRWERVVTPRGRAKVAAARIRHMIRTGE